MVRSDSGWVINEADDLIFRGMPKEIWQRFKIKIIIQGYLEIL